MTPKASVRSDRQAAAMSSGPDFGIGRRDRQQDEDPVDRAEAQPVALDQAAEVTQPSGVLLAIEDLPRLGPARPLLGRPLRAREEVVRASSRRLARCRSS